MKEDEKKRKIGLVKGLMQKLGVTPQEMINELRADLIKDATKLIKGETVCVGMFWYIDNTFSYDLLPKPIKAVVEYIDDEYIYGDLTASSLIGEVICTYSRGYKNLFCIDDVIESSAYKCEADEDIVCYNYSQMEQVCNSYALVKMSLERIKKFPRKEDFRANYWTTKSDGNFQRVFSFSEERHKEYWKTRFGEAYYRPVLRWKYN